ncbi:unnamed protein product, partial [Rotaria sp. Silwood1]
WSMARNMSAATEMRIASVLLNEKVLASGGTSESTLNSAEVYKPVTRNWTATLSMNVTRAEHSSL